MTWTKADEERLIESKSSCSNAALAKMFGRPETAVGAKLSELRKRYADDEEIMAQLTPLCTWKKADRVDLHPSVPWHMWIDGRDQGLKHHIVFGA